MTTPPPPERLNVSEYFLGDRIAAGQEGRRALLTDAGTHSYGDVQRLANRYGNALLAAGVRPEERVLLALPDGVDFVGAFFGALRMGAVVIMLNPELGREQVRYFYRYTGARALLVDTTVAGAFREATDDVAHPPRLLEVGGAGFGRELAAASEELDPWPTHRDDPAIWLFSGGTTGEPKGVVQPHRSYVNTTLRYGHGILEMAPDDVTISVPKLFFGYATGINLLFPFSVGATAALFPERCTPETLFDRIERFRPTVLVNVPTMVGKLLAEPGAATRDLSSLRLATSAGEALPEELHRRWSETWGVPLLDGMGTSEMWHIFISNRVGDVRPGTLGKVVPGYEVEVRDEEARALPRGEVGRMWVRGGSRAIGYWRHHEKTLEAFQGAWYASGDMISIDHEGWVHYRGRADDMLKVSGKWFSPRELEDCLLAHDVVAEVAVVGIADTEGLVKPHAFVVLGGAREAGPALEAEMQAWAKERLEPYKYPRAVHFLDELPRTHLGKVDRGKLARG